MPHVYSLSAEVHKPIGLGFRVKVSLLDLGMYINGMMVFPPNDEHDWAVYPPAQRAGRGKYAYLLEFNKKLPLWLEIHQACIDAVKIELPDEARAFPDSMHERPEKLDEVVIADDEPINLDDIEF